MNISAATQLGAAMKLIGQLPACLLTGLLLTACTANYVKNITVSSLETASLLDSHQVERSQSFALHRASKIYLQTKIYSEASVNSLDAPRYPKRQVTLEQELLKNLQATFPFTVRGDFGLNLQDAFLEAATLKADFLIYSYVADHEENLNTFQEISEGRGLHEANAYGPDHSTITLVLFEVYSQKMLDTIRVNSNARWFASEKNLQNHLHTATAVAVLQLSSMQ